VIVPLVENYLSQTYHEPFLGGGAVFFRLAPARACLSDVNTELIRTYETVRDRAEAVLPILKKMPVTKATYYRVRGWQPRGRIQQAARFLYLNRTAFGGIYRLNAKGEFNVPYGGGERTPAILWEYNLLERAAAALSQARLHACDFGTALGRARRGDVVYCDPTYTVAHENNGFVRYNERNFSWADQERLARCAAKAVARGAVVMVSNAYHESVRRLYAGARFYVLDRMSCVSTAAKMRRRVHEYLIVLAPRNR
jgi:DNA adenine methylase